jgi:hypothetical protein
MSEVDEHGTAAVESYQGAYKLGSEVLPLSTIEDLIRSCQKVTKGGRLL